MEIQLNEMTWKFTDFPYMLDSKKIRFVKF